MRFSIVTACFNSARTIQQTLESVASQDYPDIELIVIDGGSTDGTLEIIERCRSSIAVFVSESDRGIYDAINKGIRRASGDVVGILNSDDFYSSDSIISAVAKELDNPLVDGVYGDVAIVSAHNPTRLIRYYSSASFRPERFRLGFMPAHPSFFTRRRFYETFGMYKTDYHIAADFELLIRFLLKQNLRTKYMPLNMVTMRTGGRSSSSLYGYYILNKEVIRACRENGIETGWLRILLKYFVKVGELRTSRWKQRQ